MKTILSLAVFLSTAFAVANAQIAPQGVAGVASVGYALNYAQTATFNSSIGNQERSTASGNLDYTNGSLRLPFHAVVAGGFGWTEAGESYGVGFFENLSLSQGIMWQKTRVEIGDSLAYLPQSPVTGSSGIEGTGEPIGGSGQAPTGNQSILTLDTRSLMNAVNGSVSQQLNSAWSLSGGGSMYMLTYPDGNAVDTSSEGANAVISRRLGARSSLNGTYSFSDFSYPGTGFAVKSSSLSFGGRRQWNRSLTTSANVGVGWTSGFGSASGSGSTGSSGSSSTTLVPIPSSSRLTVTASASYLLRYGAVSVNYVRATSGGAGYLIGAKIDAVNANYSRDAGKSLTIGFEGSYSRTATLTGAEVTNSYIAGTQANWRMGRYLSVFANYTVLDQSSSTALQNSALGSLYQTISFGMGFSPRKQRPLQQ